MEAEIGENQRNEDFKDFNEKGFYKEMNMKDNPIEILGDSSLRSDFSGKKLASKQKERISKVTSKKKNKKKIKDRVSLNKDLNVIEEEMRSGRFTYDESLIQENKDDKNQSKINENININNKKDNAITRNNDKKIKDKFKNMLKFNDF